MPSWNESPPQESPTVPRPTPIELARRLLEQLFGAAAPDEHQDEPDTTVDDSAR